MHFYTLYYSTLCPDGENGHRRCRDSRFPKTVFTLYVHTDPPMDPNVPGGPRTRVGGTGYSARGEVTRIFPVVDSSPLVPRHTRVTA